jgi:hypothetical protein
VTGEIYSAHARGAASEHLAAAILTRLGWWVAMVSTQHAPFDLVCVRAAPSPRVILVDVKALNKGATARSRSVVQRLLGVRNLYVCLDTHGLSVSPATAAAGKSSDPFERNST